MLDSVSQSADGLFILLYVILLIVFFVFGPHKIYESILGSLFAFGFYIFIREITFTYPQILEGSFGGTFLVENRGNLLWLSKFLIFILLLVTPVTLGVNVFGVKRNTFWFIIKTLLLTLLFLAYFTSLLPYLGSSGGVLSEATLLPLDLGKFEYFSTSYIYSLIVNNSLSIFFLAFLLCVYKIIFSHWMTSVFVFGGVIYYQGVKFFGKKNNDIHMVTESPEAGDEEHHDGGHHHSH